MPEFLQLPREDQREALLVAAERSGRPLHLLEKDVWVEDGLLLDDAEPIDALLDRFRALADKVNSMVRSSP